jgi:hypothetical protein
MHIIRGGRIYDPKHEAVDGWLEKHGLVWGWCPLCECPKLKCNECGAATCTGASCEACLWMTDAVTYWHERDPWLYDEVDPDGLCKRSDDRAATPTTQTDP